MIYSNKVKQFLSTLSKDEYKYMVRNTVTNLDVHLLVEAFKTTKRSIIVVSDNLFHAKQLLDKTLQLIDEESISFFPSDELCTTEFLAASLDFQNYRLQTLAKLALNKQQIVITHTQGLIRRERKLSYWKKCILTLTIGQKVKQSEFLEFLVSLGYKREYQVEKLGDFACRGYVVDIFLHLQTVPVRIEFEFDEIKSLRLFNLNTIRSVKNITEVNIVPNTEFLFSEKELHDFTRKIKKNNVSSKVLSDLDDIGRKEQLLKHHKYLGYFCTTSISCFIENSILVIDNPKRVLEAYDTAINDVSINISSDKTYQYIKKDIYHDITMLLKQAPKVVYFEKVLQSNLNYTDILTFNAKNVASYDGNVKQFIKDLDPIKSYIFNSQSKLCEILKPYIFIKLITKSFVEEPGYFKSSDYMLSFELENIIYVNDQSVLKSTLQKKAQILKGMQRITSKEQLQEGDYIVHIDYGIGKYLGIIVLNIDGNKNDYLHIQYKDDEKLYVPVENIHLLQKYIGSGGFTPKLNSIGSNSWKRTKNKVSKRINDMAETLMKLYQERTTVKGFKFESDTLEQQNFEKDFEYQETVDQLRAISEIKQDMMNEYPMDRLLCGDVGYGKTEVAMRATFKAIQSLKQVAYLCPTTILSKQHFDTFINRFNKYGVRVELLNRFVNKRKQQNIVKGVKDGMVDVLIGTHRILSKDIQFDDLGLLIIDEEQRFGVRHKEKIKEFRNTIDVLTLSATPIPRTLQMALTGVKSTSLITTPPANRYPVQTYVIEENINIVKEVIMREIAREGQVFVLYNRVKTIHFVTKKLQTLLPEVRFAFVHGQMDKTELENIMNDFIDKKYDCLVSTTIIETGIDIPNANSLIVFDADNLGLSQLYQIRGRVGRSDQLGYAYLMYKSTKVSTDAEKRLQTIKEFTELGSGYKIALRDLNIRGAGDILGREQSGFIDTIGLDLYMKMLNEEIKKRQGIKSEKPEAKKASPLKISKHIPDVYTKEPENKINLHRKIKNVKNFMDAEKLYKELKDCFGYIPDEIKQFVSKQIFDNLVNELEIDKIIDSASTVKVRFSRYVTASIDVDYLMKQIVTNYENIKFQYKNNRITLTIIKTNSYLNKTIEFLQKLKSNFV